MKKRHYSLLFLLGCALTANAQQPTGHPLCADTPAQTDSVAMPSDTTAQQSLLQILLPHDSLLREATAGDSLDLAVFGRYARDNDRYAQLVGRFNRADTTLTAGDLCTLYYGYAYRDEYRGGNPTDTLNTLMAQQRYGKAYKLACDMLQEYNPASADILAGAFFAGINANRPAKEMDSIAWRLNHLILCMCLFGDGTEAYPIPVVNVGDETAFVYYYIAANEIVKQDIFTRADGSTCKRIEIPPQSAPFFDGSVLWFDISLPVNRLTQISHERLDAKMTKAENSNASTAKTGAYNDITENPHL